MPRWRVLSMLLGASLAWGAHAAADPLPPRNAEPAASVVLRWSAPPGCPDEGAVVALVDQLVTRAPVAPLEVNALVSGADDVWSVSLTLAGAASGTRTVRARSCRAVARAAALVVALAVDPNARLAAEEAAPEEPRAPSPPPLPLPPAPPRPPPPSRAAAGAPLVPLAFVRGTAGVALQPGLALGVEVGPALAWRGLRIELAGQGSPSTTTKVERAAGRPASGTVALLGVAARACLGRELAGVALGGCVGARGVRLAARGVDLAPSYTQTAWQLALEPGVLVRAPARARLGLEVGGAAVVPVTRPELVVLANGAPVHLFRAPPVGVHVGLGASLRF